MPRFKYSVILILLSLGCLNNVEDVSGVEQSDVSFMSEVQPILNRSCVGCHSSGSLNFSSYTSIINSVGNNYGSNIIVAGDADASGLVDVIEENPKFVERMPTSGNYLSGNEIQTIRAWINEGALNN